MSDGISARNDTLRPVRGCTNASVSACSACLSRRAKRFCTNALRLAETGPNRTAPPAIRLIPEHRMSHVLRMHANLVRSSRLQPKSNQRGMVQGLQRFVMRNGAFALARRRYGHPFSVAGIAPDSAFDAPVGRVWNPPQHRKVPPRNGVLRKLTRQAAMGVVVFGDNQQAGRVFVEAVHDSRTDRRDAARIRKRMRGGKPDVFPPGGGEGFAIRVGVHADGAGPHMVQQCIHQGARAMPVRRMHHHAGGFVHHDHGVVFVGNVQWDRFGSGFDRGRAQ